LCKDDLCEDDFFVVLCLRWRIRWYATAGIVNATEFDAILEAARNAYGGKNRFRQGQKSSLPPLSLDETLLLGGELVFDLLVPVHVQPVLQPLAQLLQLLLMYLHRKSALNQVFFTGLACT
jgi:hypothetical protein